MSGVAISGKILPLNGGAFPVFEDINGEGGFRSVATIAERNAVSANPLFCKEGMLVYVKSLQVIYELAPDLTTWLFYDASPNLSSQLTWYVSTTGDDNNDGTIGAPLASLAELTNRLNPRGKILYLTANMTVNVSAPAGVFPTWPRLALNVASNPLALATVLLSVVFNVTQSAAMTLTNAIASDATTFTRGELVASSGAFVNQERVKFLTGTCAGAIVYSCGIVGANPLHTFIYPPLVPTVAWLQLGDAQPLLIPAIGDTCCVETIVHSCNQIIINAYGFARVAVFDTKVRQVTIGGSIANSIYQGNGGNVMLFGCVGDSVSGGWSNNCNGAFAVGCRIPIAKRNSFIGNGWCLAGLVVQGLGAVGGGSSTSYGVWIDGAGGAGFGRFVIGQSTNFDHPYEERATLRAANAVASSPYGAFEVENGHNGGHYLNDSCIWVTGGSNLIADDLNSYFWGASNPYSFAFIVLGNSFITVGNNATGNITNIFAIPSTVNFMIGNLNFSYSDNPISLNNANCGLVVSNEILIGTNSSSTDGVVRQINQSGNIAPTAFPGMLRAGGFRVSAYLATTAIDAAAVGSPTLNIIYTDDSTVTKTQALVVGPSLAVLGGVGGEAYIESVAGQPISYSITGITSAGNARYSIRLRVEKDCVGP